MHRAAARARRAHFRHAEQAAQIQESLRPVAVPTYWCARRASVRPLSSLAQSARRGRRESSRPQGTLSRRRRPATDSSAHGPDSDGAHGPRPSALTLSLFRSPPQLRALSCSHCWGHCCQWPSRGSFSPFDTIDQSLPFPLVARGQESWCFTMADIYLVTPE